MIAKKEKAIVGKPKINLIKIYVRQLLYADCLGRTGLNAGSALCTLLFVHDRYFIIAKGDGLLGAFLDAGSAAYAFISVNDCRHY